jgi:hypothetical protein
VSKTIGPCASRLPPAGAAGLGASAARVEEFVAEWGPRTTAQQRLTEVRLHRALLEEGCQVVLTTIHQYLQERKRQQLYR